MRLLQLKDLKEGMTVAHPLYGINGEILVKENGTLTRRVLDKLNMLGWNYLYVEDGYSKDIKTKSLISPEVKKTAIVHLKNFYTIVEELKDANKEVILKRKDLYKAYDACVASAKDILDDLVTESVTLVDIYDVKTIQNYQYGHSVNVLIISVVIGKALGFNEMQLHELALAAFFHDVGLCFLPKEIIDKPGKYTDEDTMLMRKHAEFGYRFIKEYFSVPMKSYLGILQHHERFDGTGYPLGKSGKEIIQYARILAVADVYDALTTDKPYREAMTPVGAFKHVIQSNKTAFDPEIVKLFFEKVSPYPIGFTLHLPDGRDAIVVENVEGQPLYPKVKVIRYQGLDIQEPYITILE